MGAANSALNPVNQLATGPQPSPPARLPQAGVLAAGVVEAPGKKKRVKKLPPQVEKEPQGAAGKPPVAKNPMNVMLGVEVGKPSSPYRK